MNTEFKKIFGESVKHFRLLKNYSQEKLAELIGISANTVSYIERGKNPISFTKLPSLCKALEIEPYKLFINNQIFSDEDKINIINDILDI